MKTRIFKKWSIVCNLPLSQQTLDVTNGLQLEYKYMYVSMRIMRLAQNKVITNLSSSFTITLINIQYNDGMLNYLSSP